MIYLKRLFFRLIGMTPAKMEMVQYWKRNASVQAKVMKKNGVLVMQMEGEKHIFPGFPRGYLLFGKLSKLKHELKNQIFNESWALLEKGESPVEHVKKVALPNVLALLENTKYDRVPEYRMVPAVREIHRAWTKVIPGTVSLQVRDLLTFIFQEDDSYRFRIQWVVSYFNPNGILNRFRNPVLLFEKAFEMLENAEVIGDMKERVRLWRRVLVALLNDPENRKAFTALCREIDWSKVKLSKADKFFFRGKYFKVDLDLFDY